MLQQILNDMYIDPELLSELDEEQKQILFCKMREEQVRKWKIRDEQTKEEDYCRRKKEGGKKVSFLMGGDGEPLVVVLGGDEDVDAILQERAKRQAEMEEEAIRKAAEEELDKLVRLSQSTVKAMERNVGSTPPPQTTYIKDPTREAVVRSLQEATREMEEEMRALEVEEKEGFTQPTSMASVFRNAASTNLGNSKPLKDNVNASRKSSYTNISPHVPIICNGTSSMRDKNEEYNNRCYSSSKPQISISPYAFDRSPIIPFGVAAQIEQFERLSESSLEALKTATLERAKNRRQKEILDNLRNQVEAAKNEANKSMEGTVIVAEKEEVAWREQEKKAKEAERRIREIARRAREEHRRTSSDTNNSFDSSMLIDSNPETSPVLNGDINGNIKPGIHDFRSSEHILDGRNNANLLKGKTRSRSYRPPNREAVVSWFKEEELPKLVGINIKKNVIEPWFHGIISRAEAERTLEKAETGSFLVRVSERIWGYAVSYKAPERCRHYLIDAIGGKYAFLGSHRNNHLSLGKLIEYHKEEYITSSGKEILDKPCGQLDPSNPDYYDLFEGTDYVNII